MNKIQVNLQNCFGINEMQHEFDFHDNNVIAIYARNGLMKTSFAKTFQKIQMEKVNEIRDNIFNDIAHVEVKIDGENVDSADIFVINSFESTYESDITPLLVKDTVKQQLQDVLVARDKLFKALENASGLKIKRTTDGRANYELETAIIQDFGFEETSILLNLESILAMEEALCCGDIAYATIFDATVLRKIQTEDFQAQIQAFVTSSNRIYESFEYLEKGQLTLPKLKDVRKALKKDSFFVRNNQLVLGGKDVVNDIKMLENKIKEIEAAIRKVPELQSIEQLLSDAKGILLKDVIETHPEIVEYLTIDQLPILRKALWLSYIHDNQGLFDDLYEKYCTLSEAIDAVVTDDTPWNQALDIFKKRFRVPFSMDVSNLKGAIIGESIPRIDFLFTKGNRTVRINRTKLDEINTLSQGEKRALYLLNIIFDIEQIRMSGQRKLLIVDDIADSFDYKNKYAIVEYLYELSQEGQFFLIILSHNFDFYRTVSSRLNLKRANRLIANDDGTRIKIEQEHYQNKPFEKWKQKPDRKNVLALIPFVRNLIEFRRDEGNSQTESEYLFLTALLHEKENTHSITFAQLLPVYQTYIGIAHYEMEIQMTDIVLESLYSIADTITVEDTWLENKIILAMAIRHKAEEYMIREISIFQGDISWKKDRRIYSGKNIEFLEAVQTMTNQTRELYNGYVQFGTHEAISILNEVNIMTPENIHLNSFMYEPILDMDVVELLNLYTTIRNL